jgi:hypothetical protein
MKKGKCILIFHVLVHTTVQPVSLKDKKSEILRYIDYFIYIYIYIYIYIFHLFLSIVHSLNVYRRKCFIVHNNFLIYLNYDLFDFRLFFSDQIFIHSHTIII